MHANLQCSPVIIIQLYCVGQNMLQYPKFDPIALQIGPLAIHWYGLMLSLIHI